MGFIVNAPVMFIFGSTDSLFSFCLFFFLFLGPHVSPFKVQISVIV